MKENCEMELTDSLAMTPAASVCGVYISHPKSHYFSVGKICSDQVSSVMMEFYVYLYDNYVWVDQCLNTRSMNTFSWSVNK